MKPDAIRIRAGFRLVAAATLASLSASTPARAQFIDAQAFGASTLAGAAPLALALGALGFGALAALLVRRWHRDDARRLRDTQGQLAQMRAALDEYEALLSGMPEVTLIWTTAGTPPRVLGRPGAVLPKGRMPDIVTDFGAWIAPADTEQLAARLNELRSDGAPFEITLTTRDERLVHASGRVVGGAAVLRMRAAAGQPGGGAIDPRNVADIPSARAILGLLSKPAWVRDEAGRLIYVNPAYRQLAGRTKPGAPPDRPPELFEPVTVKQHLMALDASNGPVVLSNVVNGTGGNDLVLFAIEGGSAGYLRPREQGAEKSLDASLGHITGIIDALTTPIAIFDARRQLLHFNRAYATLWDLDPDWLQTGLDERAILDRLRTQGLLPAESDYREWRARHLRSYQLTAPREEAWHLPGGTTLNVVAAPASAKGGVIYVFEDVTERLKLESQNKALANVQRETLNALSEGVAVFGTNGRLTLSNPRLSALWRLPTGELGEHPHIDQISEACARAMPEDGAIIWRDLKRAIVDLNPTRTDTSGRINRADGRLIDYAVVRLPDGQTMMSFEDVTESASYSRVLKERNDALITADRLKDAFVQNVSYELRSPLTNIIGFADLLASGEFGPLNERQRAYTDYIRASSATLGVLIDNILDLTNVDAGIAELTLEEQDLPALIEKVKAGLAATFLGIDKEHQFNLVVDIADDLPRFVADGTRIVQVLYNLLSNAARFSEPGAEIRLSVEGREPERIVFRIEDEGAGIPEDVRQAMFRRFEGQSVQGHQRGAGLGLAIVKTFVNLHGGTVSVARREPRGTVVTVNLPADAASAAGVAEAGE